VKRTPVDMRLILIALASAALCVIPGITRAQIFVANINTNTIGEYDAATGATINSSFISGLNQPVGIALSGGNLFVTNHNTNTIGEYNATTGATINSSFISSSEPEGIAVVPEPATWALLLLGMTAIFGRRFFVRRSA